ncbi:MAG: hypothetical protein AAFY07_08625 [Pseudomonadota bacterium]
MTSLIATSVVRGSNQGESHGGIYLINTDTDEILQPVDWNRMDIDWQGRGWDRGLRGIAFHNDHIWVAASDELFEFNQKFELVASFKNEYLKHCHEISVFGRHVFIASTGFDSILGFDLEARTFNWALQVQTDGLGFAARRYDPQGEEGPLMLNKLHLNSVFCEQGGMFFSGLRMKSLLRFDGRNVGVLSTLPEGTHNARPFEDGIIFNDTAKDVVRIESPARKIAMRLPKYAPHKLTHTKMDDTRVARQGFGRGLCVLPDNKIAVGSSPSTVTIYNLDTRKPEKAINLSMDVRNAIHGLEIWPYDWPQ